MKILVTGGAGFIGSHITDALIDAGHNVVIIDNLSTGVEENINKHAKFYLRDIKDDTTDIFEIEKPDIVCHQAAQIDVRKSVNDPVYDAEINIIGSLKLLENSVKNSVKKFIFASSGGAGYGEQDYFPADEEHKMQPYSPYGITKLVVEKYLFYYNLVYGLNYTVLRYANVYGPRQNPHGEAGVVSIFINNMLKGKQPVINGDGKQTRDYVNVFDVVKANLLVLNETQPDIYNVGTGVETDVNGIFRKINYHFGNEFSEHHGPAKPGEQMRSVITSGKMMKKFGWQPQINLDEGIEQTVEYFRKKFKA